MSRATMKTKYSTLLTTKKKNIAEMAVKRLNDEREEGQVFLVKPIPHKSLVRYRVVEVVRPGKKS